MRKQEAGAQQPVFLSPFSFLFSKFLYRKTTTHFARHAFASHVVAQNRVTLLLAREFETHLAEAFGIVTPVFAHLDKQEEMDRLLKDFR